MSTVFPGTVTEVSTAHFDWTGSHGTAEASDLEFRPGNWPASLVVVSTLTSTRLVFNYYGTSATRDGEDVASVHYTATTCGRLITLAIFND